MLGVMMYRFAVRAASGRRLRPVRRNIPIVMSRTYAERKYGTPEWLTNHHKMLRHSLGRGQRISAEVESAYLAAKADVDRAQSVESKTFFGKAILSAQDNKD